MKNSKIDNTNNTTTCKKCGRKLPAGYKAKLCENCLGNKIGNARKIGMAVAGILGTAATIVLAVLKKR